MWPRDPARKMIDTAFGAAEGESAGPVPETCAACGRPVPADPLHEAEGVWSFGARSGVNGGRPGWFCPDCRRPAAPAPPEPPVTTTDADLPEMAALAERLHLYAAGITERERVLAQEVALLESGQADLARRLARCAAWEEQLRVTDAEVTRRDHHDRVCYGLIAAALLLWTADLLLEAVGIPVLPVMVLVFGGLAALAGRYLPPGGKP